MEEELRAKQRAAEDAEFKTKERRRKEKAKLAMKSKLSFIGDVSPHSRRPCLWHPCWCPLRHLYTTTLQTTHCAAPCVHHLLLLRLLLLLLLTLLLLACWLCCRCRGLDCRCWV
jgi:hypothetical protein